jgi:predicted phage terminase large subunit-like protein
LTTLAESSLRDSLLSLPAEKRAQFLTSLSEDEAAVLLYDWQLWARPDQLAPPGDWDVWLIQAGRGYGKTRAGAEWVRQQVAAGKRRVALVGRTAADLRETMVCDKKLEEGDSGILAICPPWDRPHYEPSKRRLTWPNGAIATTYSADEPDLLRGPQHDAAWCDELASYQNPQTWDNLLFGLRLGDHPQAVVTTTPRPRRIIRDLVADPRCHVTRGNTYQNLDNLAPSFIRTVVRKYEGTTLGRQELFGELLAEIPGAHWTLAMIEAARIPKAPEDLVSVVVAIDPAVTSEESSDETGIIVAGKDKDEHGYVLEDLSGRYTPAGWADVAIKAYQRHKADRIVAEVNNGGDMVENTLRMCPGGGNVSYSSVHASRGKAIRAEPVAALYEQGRIHHVGGFAELEDQMVSWTPESDVGDDRMDALVWAFTELMLEEAGLWSFFRQEKAAREAKEGRAV